MVGHSCGGASISYAMECHPKKISKAIFLSATMVLDGQKPFDVLSDEVSMPIVEFMCSINVPDSALLNFINNI